MSDGQVQERSERIAEVQCGEGAHDGQQNGGDADLHDALPIGLRGLQLLYAQVESCVDLCLETGICGEGKAVEADDGAATIVRVLLARGTLEEVLPELLLLLSGGLADE